MSFSKHPTALVQSTKIGKNTRIWAFTNILAGATLGEDCNICDHVFIENDVTIGNRVTVKCGVQIWDGISIEDDVFIGPNVTFSNDKFPRSKQYPDKFEKTTVRKGASVGANATILPGLVIEKGAMVSAGAVVTRDVPPNAIVAGNPARIRGYMDPANSRSLQALDPVRETSLTTRPKAGDPVTVKGVHIHHLPEVTDLRGTLSFGEFPKHLPFSPKRYFMICNVPDREVRGEHAHKELHQFQICVKGSVNVVADDGKNRQEFVLNHPTVGLHFEPMVWGIQYKYSKDAILLVLASDVYKADDYIRDYDEFLKVIGTGKRSPKGMS